MKCDVCGKESDGETSVKLMRWIVKHYRKHGYPLQEIRVKLDQGCGSLWICRDYEDMDSRGREYLISNSMRLIIIDDQDGTTLILGKGDGTFEPLTFKRKDDVHSDRRTPGSL